MPSFSRSWGVALVLSLPLFVACAASDFGASAGGQAGTAGAGSDPADDAPDALAFEPSTPLALTPGERRELRVAVAPAGSHRVRFALMGTSHDSSLDRAEAQTDTDGNASVWLTAPSDVPSAAFRVRASVGTLSTELDVAVSSSGFARLEVRPQYSGSRTIAWWRASVHLGTRCQDITSNPPADGEFARDAVFRTYPQLTGIPAGQALAVTVRGENMAGGCADVPSLSVADLNTVTVPITDVPLKLDATDMKVKLAFDSISPDTDALLAPTRDAAFAAVLGGAPNDAVALLDAMEEHVPEPLGEGGFAQRREWGNWDNTLWADIDGAPPLAPIRDAITTLLADTHPTLDSGVLLEAELVAAEAPGTATLRPTALGGFAAPDAGLIPDETTVSWKADPSDVVLLGARLPWSPTPFVWSVAETTALGAESAPASMDEVLAAAIDCAAVAEHLVAAAYPGSGEAFLGCDVACAEELCASAAETLWQRARAAAGDGAEVNVSATGDAYVDASANVVGFTGQWLGGITVGGTPLATVQGHARGTPYDIESTPAR